MRQFFDSKKHPGSAWIGVALVAIALAVLPFALPVFPILLIVLGLMVLFGSRRADATGGKAS